MAMNPLSSIDSGTLADATEVDGNFSTIETFINGNVVHADGSVAMTGELELSSSSPSAALSAASKGYVDAQNGTGVSWIAITGFTNSWVNYGGGYQEAEYRKVGDRVEVRGVIASGTFGSAAFTLPSGYRPPAKMFFHSVAATYEVAFIDVLTDGTVTPNSGSGFSLYLPINFSFSVTA